MDIHSSWRHADIADLIPELNGALADPAHIDAEILHNKLEKVLGKQISDIQALIASDDFQKIGHTEDPHALARVLQKLEVSMLDIKRVVTFSQLAPLHYADQQAELEAPLNAMAQQLQGVAGFLNQSFSQVIRVLQLDDAQLRDMMANSEELRKFAPLIEKCRKAPSPNLEIASQLNVNDFTQSLERFQASGSSKLSDDEKKQAFAEGLTGVLRFKSKQAEASGFKDTIAQFAFANEAPQDLIDNLAAASQKHMATLVSDFTEIQKLAKISCPKANRSTSIHGKKPKISFALLMRNLILSWESWRAAPLKKAGYWRKNMAFPIPTRLPAYLFRSPSIHTLSQQ